MLTVHRIILTTLYLPAFARALTYSLGQASQCGDLQVTWSEATGGDLNLLILPVSPRVPSYPVNSDTETEMVCL